MLMKYVKGVAVALRITAILYLTSLVMFLVFGEMLL